MRSGHRRDESRKLQLYVFDDEAVVGCSRKACGVPGNNFGSSLIIERSIWRIGGSCTVPGGEWGHFLSFARHYFRFEWKNVPCNFLIEFRRLLCQCLVSDYCCALSGVESFGWKWHLREAAAGEQFRALVRDSCGSETVGDADNDLERRHWRWLRSWCHSSSLIETSSVKTRGHLKQEMDYIESSTERYLTVNLILNYFPWNLGHQSRGQLP